MNQLHDRSREGMPSPSRITEWWLSHDGKAYVKELSSRYGTSLSKSLGKIPSVKSRCWACGCCEGRSSLGLDRCHILPLALGGGNEESNLLMMCRSCHQDNPDTPDLEIFWRWFRDVKEEWLHRLGQAAFSQSAVIDIGALVKDYHCYIRAEPPILVNGALSKGFTIGLIRRLISLQTKRLGASPVVGSIDFSDVGKVLAKAHNAAEKRLRIREMAYNRAGFSPSLRRCIKFMVISAAQDPQCDRERFKERLRSFFIREFGRIDGVLKLCDDQTTMILNEVAQGLEASASRGEGEFSTQEAAAVKLLWSHQG